MKFKKGSNQYKKIPVYHDNKVIATLSYHRKFKHKIRDFCINFMEWFDEFMIKWIKRSAFVALLLFISTTSLKLGQTMTVPQIVHADTITTVKTPITFDDIPMLQKICKAESSNRQFNADGSVLRGKINKSDLGFCQINEVINNDLARKLGYDIYTEQGNKDFAVYLYLTRGTQPWLASQKSATNTNGWSI